MENEAILNREIERLKAALEVIYIFQNKPGNIDRYKVTETSKSDFPQLDPF